MCGVSVLVTTHSAQQSMQKDIAFPVPAFTNATVHAAHAGEFLAAATRTGLKIRSAAADPRAHCIFFTFRSG
jgi:hypothetical protein